MAKQSLYTIVLSVVASTAANLLFDRQREPVLPEVIRAKRVELIDAQGRIRATFELAKNGRDGVVPIWSCGMPMGVILSRWVSIAEGMAPYRLRVNTGTKEP